MRHPCLPAALALALLVATAATAARADIIELKDGRLIEGVVVEKKDVLVVHSRFGPTAVATKDVKRREKATSVDAQIRTYLKQLDPDDQVNRARLARWLEKIGRKHEAAALAQAVLEEDPQSAVAHQVLGHVRHRGVWRTPDEAKRADGLERHGDRWYTPEEWKQASSEAKQAAEAADRKRWQQETNQAVNRAVQLMLSPDPELRTRGKASLETMAKEYDNPSLVTLASHVAAYRDMIDALDEARVRAAAGGGGGRTAMVYPEMRASLSRLKRPIEVFETSLASSLGASAVRIQLPELEVIDIRTMVGIPAVVR